MSNYIKTAERKFNYWRGFGTCFLFLFLPLFIGFITYANYVNANI